jgi:hypothetical protein
MWLVSTVQNGVLNESCTSLLGIYLSSAGAEGSARKGSVQRNSLNSLVLARKIEVVFALKPLFGCINGGL